jgi:polyketide biosynthesis acyl carrier protein
MERKMITKDEIFKQIVIHTKDVVPELGKHDFVILDSLKELGANSVDRAEIITKMMEFLELDIPRVDLYGAKNINDLVEIFYEKKQATN